MTVTPTALTKLIELKENDSDILYVSILGGGCSGLSYQMKWIHYKSPYDKQIFTDWLNNIIIGSDNKSAIFLENVQLDYEGGLNGKGFIWSNPDAKRICGCGTSFSV